METGRLITLQMLEDAEACSEQIEEFKERFGDSVKVTKKLCLSVANVFDWWFAASHFLGEPLREAYYKQLELFREEFDRRYTPLWTEFNSHRSILWKESIHQAAPFRKEYDRKIASLQKEYSNKITLLWDEYYRQCAIAFWKLYNSEA